MLERQSDNPECFDLLEEGMRQAASSLSDERRGYIASLIAHSISNEDISHRESRHLLRMLGELIDVEIIWLRSYVASTIGGDEEFREKHSVILDTELAHMGSPQSVHDKNSLEKSYKTHLVRLGLLEERNAVDSENKQPKFDNYGRIKTNGYGLISLGRLLLRTIGLPDEEG